MTLIVEASDGRLPDGPVHLLDLTNRLQLVRLCEPVLDVVRFADHVDTHLVGLGGVPVAGLPGELNVIVGHDGVDTVRHDWDMFCLLLTPSFRKNEIVYVGSGAPACGLASVHPNIHLHAGRQGGHGRGIEGIPLCRISWEGVPSIHRASIWI